jgi:hypothetical protein
MRQLRAIGLLLCPAILGATPLLAVNQLSMPRLDLSGRQLVPIHCSHDLGITGFSLSIAYNPAIISVTAVVEGQTLQDYLTANPQANHFSSGKINSTKGTIVWGVVLDLNDPKAVLPATTDDVLMQLDVTTRTTGVTGLQFKDGLGDSFPISNLFVDALANSIPPALVSGIITVGYFGPTAQAGPDRFAGENSTITLDSSGTIVFPGLTPTFQWKQLSGPAAQFLGGSTGAQAKAALPAVTGDTPLVFQLTAGDGVQSSTDQVAVTTVDLDLRTGTLTGGASTAAQVVSGGKRAMVFQGDLKWESSVEDGLFTGLRFSASGDGDESTLLTGATLYVDENGNGTFDDADRQLGGRTAVASDNGQVAFSFSERMATGTSRRFFLVVDLAQPKAQAAGGLVTSLGLAAVAAFLIRIGRGLLLAGPGRAAGPWRRLGPLALILVLGLPLLTISCGGGGGGSKGASAPASRGVRFDLADPSDVGLQGASTGVPISATSGAIEGPALDV